MTVGEIGGRIEERLRNGGTLTIDGTPTTFPHGLLDLHTVTVVRDILIVFPLGVEEYSSVGPDEGHTEIREMVLPQIGVDLCLRDQRVTAEGLTQLEIEILQTLVEDRNLIVLLTTLLI